MHRSGEYIRAERNGAGARTRSPGIWNTRCLRRADAEEDGQDPDEIEPTFEAEFAEFRARWPGFYTQDPPEET